MIEENTINFISTVGFPIFSAVVMFYAAWKLYNMNREDTQQTMERLRTAIDRFTLVFEKIADKLDLLDQQDKERLKHHILVETSLNELKEKEEITQKQISKLISEIHGNNPSTSTSE